MACLNHFLLSQHTLSFNWLTFCVVCFFVEMCRSALGSFANLMVQPNRSTDGQTEATRLKSFCRVSFRQHNCWAGEGSVKQSETQVNLYTHPSHPKMFLPLGHDVTTFLFFRFKGVIELGR